MTPKKHQIKDVVEDASGSEIAVGMAHQIAAKRNRIFELEDEIAGLKDTSGIIEREQAIEGLRADLLDLAREYRIAAERNFRDELGDVNFVAEGESHRFDTEKVDEGLARLIDIQAQMKKWNQERPTKYGINIGGDRVFANIEDLKTIAAVDKAAVLEALQQSEEARQTIAEELGLRIEAMLTALQEVSASRKVTTRRETVAIRKNIGNGSGK